ncbi:four helix bundle protein [bacterium]|nr:four helix bundle protein [bacterium]
MTYKKSRFRPRRPVRSFRDLEVYQKALEGAVMVAKKILPIIKENNYPLEEDMIKCSLEIPRLIAEAHSMRFDDKKSSLNLLDKAMAGCNKMVVYLEQVRDIYSDKVERVVIEELIRKYIGNRKKIFHLFKAWKRFMEKDEQG